MEIFLGIGLIALMYLWLDRSAALLRRAEQIESYANIIRLESEGQAAKLLEMQYTLDNLLLHVKVISDVADEYQGLVLRGRESNDLFPISDD